MARTATGRTWPTSRSFLTPVILTTTLRPRTGTMERMTTDLSVNLASNVTGKIPSTRKTSNTHRIQMKMKKKKDPSERLHREREVQDRRERAMMMVCPTLTTTTTVSWLMKTRKLQNNPVMGLDR
ncbi:uncharacterized protein LOC118408414 isoform X2 [Branchiostoma floridae]|nr:uncharacterized protein LOC118408414 isoform X2 [Branchiostoma floridae]